jgi:hypothetical protein
LDCDRGVVAPLWDRSGVGRVWTCMSKTDHTKDEERQRLSCDPLAPLRGVRVHDLHAAPREEWYVREHDRSEEGKDVTTRKFHAARTEQP